MGAKSQWFVDSLKTSNTPDWWVHRFKTATPTRPRLVETTPEVHPSENGVVPKQVEDFTKAGKESERQARLSLDPAKKIAHYQAAFASYQMAQDKEDAKRVLGLIGKEYELQKNDAGQKFVAAALLVQEGKLPEAIKAFETIEQGSAGTDSTFVRQVKIQHSLALQSLAIKTFDPKKPEAAMDLLKQALRLTPSDQLTGQVLKLAENNTGSIKSLREKISRLQAKLDDLLMPKTVCNSCHSPNKKDDFKSMDDSFLYPNDPDLGEFKQYTFLTHQQKLDAYYLKQDIDTAKTQKISAEKNAKEIFSAGLGTDPKAEDYETTEARLLPLAPGEFHPDASLWQESLGIAHLARKDYAKATEALKAAVQANPSNLKAQLALGEASFGDGDFDASRKAYATLIQADPRNADARRLHAEASTYYLSALDASATEEKSKVEAEIANDRAMLIALNPNGEQDKLDKLEKLLEGFHGAAKPEVIAAMAGIDPSKVAAGSKKEMMAVLEGLAQQYLSLAEQNYAEPKDAELVRGELNGLAAKTFSILARFAKADEDGDVQKQAPLYEGYALLAQGKMDEAVKTFESIRKTVPAADKILTQMENQKLRVVNLAALEAWETYNEEGESVQLDESYSISGRALVGFDSLVRSGSGDLRSDVKAKWKKEREFVAELKSRVQDGKANSILEAMKQIQSDGPESMKEEASYYIDYKDRIITGYPLGALVHFVDKLPPDLGEGNDLLHKTWDLERQNPAVKTPHAFYSIVAALDPDACYNGKAIEHKEALEGKSSFGRAAFKFITSMSPESLAVDVGIMVASAGLGNLAKLRTLASLEKAGVTGYKALAIAGVVGVGVEGTAMWVGNTGKEAMTQNTNKVFTVEHLAKSYGATLIMVGGLKGFGLIGENLGPKAAKALGLVTEGTLTTGGKALVWSIGHASGLAGMVTVSHVNQGLGFSPKPIGGWKEGLVHDVFGYAQFALAHKMADAAFGGKLNEASLKQHTEIAVKEALLLAQGQADALGFRAARGADGKPLESPARQLIIGLLMDAKLNKVGFSGDTLTKFAASRQFDKANDYFREYGMPLEYSPDGKLFAVDPGEASPHSKLGINPGKAKPPPKPVDFKELADNALKALDRAFAWFFGGPGGMGGLQLAFEGAFSTMFNIKPEPEKGPPIAMMAGKKNGGGGKKTVEIKSPIVQKAFDDFPNFEVIPYTTKPGETIDSILQNLKDHFSDPTKVIVIEATRPLDSKDVLAEKIGYYAPKARIEIHLPDGTKVEVAGKTTMDAHHEDALHSGNELYWEPGDKGVRDLFELQGKNGKIPLEKPAGVTKIELHTKKAIAPEDLEFLVGEAKRLDVELVISGDRSLTFKKTASGLEITAPKGIHAEELNRLAEVAAKQQESVTVKTEGGDIFLKKGNSAKDVEITTTSVEAALLAPERVTLLLDKAPDGASVKALKDKGVKRVRFTDDPESPGFAVRAVEAMKEAKGLNIRANDTKGKLLWENSIKAGGDSLSTQAGIFKKALLDHVSKPGVKDRLGELKKLLGPEGVRFDFTQETLRSAAAQDLADASVPPGGKTPAVSAEQFETWLKRGQDMTAFKYGKAVEKNKTSLVSELKPFAEGFGLDPAKPDAWSQATAKLVDFLGSHRDNPALLAKTFEHLQRDPLGSDAFESNAYDLAKFFIDSGSPHVALKKLDDVYSKETPHLKIRGALFGSFLKVGDLGAKRELDSLDKILASAKLVTDEGYDVTIESIPTNKYLDGSTPDFAVTVTKGNETNRYFLEVKKVATMTVARGTKESFEADLAATFAGRKTDDASLGTQLGKGLSQLFRYSAKTSNDTLILDVHLDSAPPPYFREAIKNFLAKNCPNIVVRFQYRDRQAATGVSGGRTEIKMVDVQETVRADSAAKYKNYDKNPDIFAPLQTDAVAAE